MQFQCFLEFILVLFERRSTRLRDMKHSDQIYMRRNLLSTSQ